MDDFIQTHDQKIKVFYLTPQAFFAKKNSPTSIVYEDICNHSYLNIFLAIYSLQVVLHF